MTATDRAEVTHQPAGDGALDQFRSRVRHELEGRLSPKLPSSTATFYGAGDDDDDVNLGRQVLESLAPGGWSASTWPKEYGGAGLSALEAAVVAEELSQFDTPGLYAFSVGLNMVGPVLIAYGTEEQKLRWLPKILDGSQIWCQLFSEPDAGSDLASLTTVARQMGDWWRISGQKVWSSRAHYADWGLLLARTDPSAEKHHGISAFVIPMHMEGITVRPLRQMNGDAHFNEVFLDDVPIANDLGIGVVNEGWRVAMTTLGNERANTGGGAAAFGGVPAVLELLRSSGAMADPTFRQRAAELICEMEVHRWTSMRARAARLAGATPGPEGSGGKLRLSAIGRSLAALAVDLGGLDALTHGTQAETLFLTAPSLSIRGGTDEIQHNIIGERILGLPREPKA
jgi:alkylation response protein AidB-like acyl-CoA dehydrogenase